MLNNKEKERFFAKINKHCDNGCWEWTGYRNKKNYGSTTIYRIKKTLKAHRLSWILAKGEIHDGLSVLHKCDNPSCVNPDHLFLGTHIDNMDDMCSKGRTFSKLSASQVRRIVSLKSKFTCLQLADMFNVTSGTISNIHTGMLWSKVTGISYKRKRC